MIHEAIHEYLWSVNRAEDMLKNGDVSEVHILLGGEHSNQARVSVIDNGGWEMVLFPEKRCSTSF